MSIPMPVADLLYCLFVAALVGAAVCLSIVTRIESKKEREKNRRQNIETTKKNLRKFKKSAIKNFNKGEYDKAVEDMAMYAEWEVQLWRYLQSK